MAIDFPTKYQGDHLIHAGVRRPPRPLAYTLVNHSGSGILAGQFPDGITSIEGEPTPATVRILYRPESGAPGDGVVVAEVQSNQDGTWLVEGLNPNLKYDVVGRKDGFNDVIMAKVSPVNIDFYHVGGFTFDADTREIHGFVTVVGGSGPLTLEVVRTIPGIEFTLTGASQILAEGVVTSEGVFPLSLVVKDSDNRTLTIEQTISVEFAFPLASGGVVHVLEDGGAAFRVHEFPVSGNFLVSRGGDMELVIVGAGGSGGANNTGGGGGAGEVVTSILPLPAGNYTVEVGEGGASVTGGPGENGGPSFLLGPDGLIAYARGGGGGGGGGSGNATENEISRRGRDGGSGGGGGGTWNVSITPPGGAGFTGYAGGMGNNTPNTTSRAGGGGGGALGVGGDAANGRGGFGGAGYLITITGFPFYAAAGGQGGTNGSGERVAASGVGGMGASGQQAATDGGVGCGGGGSKETPTALRASGAGGRGAVFIKYQIG